MKCRLLHRRWHRREPQTPSEIATREATLRAEQTRAEAARLAVIASEMSVQVERARLQDSHEIAARLREHTLRNGFTEKLAASMKLRKKGGNWHE